MNSHQLFRRSRLRLAFWYASVMGVILSLFGLGMYRSLVRANWVALEREIESIAGTLHDSLEPMLPASEDPTTVLQQIFPDLCLVGQSCHPQPTLIQRHTIGISDRSIYYIRLFDRHGKLLAFSPNQPSVDTRNFASSQTLNRTLWQTLENADGIRYRQFTTILHSANANAVAPERRADPPKSPLKTPLDFESGSDGVFKGGARGDLSWGYLQIGRTLASFDAEVRRIQLIFTIGLPITLGLVAISSWWLSGLAMQPIYQSYQQQQQFTANAAHELRSPLASLLATVEATLRVPPLNPENYPENYPENIYPMLNTIERQGRRLSHLIADLLLLSSLEQNTFPEKFKACCLNDIVNDLVEDFLELAIQDNLQIHSQITGEAIYVFGDEQQLYRLVSNLIANAIKYTPNGGSINISLEQRDAIAIVKIEDTGIGISPQKQSRIFDRFYRVDSDRDRQTGGTGLGLAIARAIAQKHQAQIKVESIVGKGSIFTLQMEMARSIIHP